MERLCGRHDDPGSGDAPRSVRQDHGPQGQAAQSSVAGEDFQMRNTWITILGALLGLLISPVHAQQSGKKAYMFRGKVEKVDTVPNPLTVTNEPIDGWIVPMTMAYVCDKPTAI